MPKQIIWGCNVPQIQLQELSCRTLQQLVQAIPAMEKMAKDSMIFIVPVGLFIILFVVTDPKLLINTAKSEPVLGLALLSWLLLSRRFYLLGCIYFLHYLIKNLRGKNLQQREGVNRTILRAGIWR